MSEEEKQPLKYATPVPPRQRPWYGEPPAAKDLLGCLIVVIALILLALGAVIWFLSQKRE